MYEEQLAIYNKAKKIVASNLEWKEKYDMVFSDEISAQLNFDWCDPDCDYDDDVYAFMAAFDEYMVKMKERNNI